MVRGLSTKGKSGLTLTDALTRRNIASGRVSPTYMSTVDHKEHFRGVVQADRVKGADLSYLSSYYGYGTPNRTNVSGHTNQPHAGTMTAPIGERASNVVSQVKSKIGTLGLLAALFIGFFILERGKAWT